MNRRNIAGLLISTISLLIVASIGSIWIDKSYSHQIRRIDQQLQADALAVQNLKTNQTSVALTLAKESSFHLALAFVAEDGTFALIRESDAKIDRALTPTEFGESAASAISLYLGTNNRIRSITLTNGDHLIFAANQEGIIQTRNRDFKFLFLLDILLALLLYFLTRFMWDRNHVRNLELIVASEQENRARMQSFLGDASHELRTPLTVIKGYIELLHTYPDIDPEDSAKYVNRVFSEVQRMEALIRDLLLLAELGETSSVENEECDLYEIARGFVMDLQILQPSRKVLLESPEPLLFMGSTKLLTQMFSNIFSNAARHTSPNVELRLMMRQESNRIIIQYDDAGAGLPEGFHSNEMVQFSRFEKSRSRETGGSGLGMSIMKSIVQAHHGEISLGRSPLGGLHINISLPI